MTFEDMWSYAYRVSGGDVHGDLLVAPLLGVVSCEACVDYRNTHLYSIILFHKVKRRKGFTVTNTKIKP